MMETRSPARGPKQRLEITRLEGGRSVRAGDEVAREEPLQLMVDREPLAILMRTPGSDLELALGLLHSEGVIRRLGDVKRVRLAPSGQVAWPRSTLELEPDPRAENLVDVQLQEPVLEGRLGWQRTLPSSSACGICGSATLEALQRFQEAVSSDRTWPVEEILSLPGRLAAAQPVFSSTGGLHAAGVVACGEQQMSVAEDVGRHNAVDKLVGQALLEDRLPLSDCCLVVSGRAGFEIVQKAAAAQLAVLVSISAPSSLAVQTADALGVTLVGFARGGTANVYTHPERLRLGARVDRRSAQ